MSESTTTSLVITTRATHDGEPVELTMEVGEVDSQLGQTATYSIGSTPVDRDDFMVAIAMARADRLDSIASEIESALGDRGVAERLLLCINDR